MSSRKHPIIKVSATERPFGKLMIYLIEYVTKINIAPSKKNKIILFISFFVLFAFIKENIILNPAYPKKGAKAVILH